MGSTGMFMGRIEEMVKMIYGCPVNETEVA
jgi:hypothetical protein